jgi:sugar lactone lactonase YvrE
MVGGTESKILADFDIRTIGIAISADGNFFYFTPIASRDLYRVETSALRGNTNKDPQAFLRAADSVQYLGEVRIRKSASASKISRPYL